MKYLSIQDNGNELLISQKLYRATTFLGNEKTITDTESSKFQVKN